MKPILRNKISRSGRFHIMVWINVAVQMIFPLAVSFTPAVMASASRERLLRTDAHRSSLQTQVYTLSAGENVTLVAKKFNMDLASLRQLNQLRTFARGFEHLQAGDELDVPLTPLPEVKWTSPSATAPHEGDDTQARKAAGYASQAGTFLASKSSGEAAANAARSMATGAAGGEVQQWLSQFGTARVQLDADKNFSLKNSQFDLLVPLHDSGSNLVYAQGSLHRTDDRTQSNLGVGIRHFGADHMLGANVFGDYDLSRDHARAGAGLEYGRDFLKLAANGYMRLTGWKNAPELQDYEARPANGWDVRAQAWLPSLPQLGGKVTYEQYYGKEVALFGKENRQRNPHAVTAGVNYTPVPLITLGAEHRQGQSGKNDARLSMDVNYQLGMAWQHQVNPDAVAALRRLAGSRLDLVERNNNIVLEYRKLELIRLRAASLVSGYTGEHKSLGVTVSSKYALDHIDWSASALEAAGGAVVQNGSGYDVVLPNWQATAAAVNTYTVTGVAVDVKGNRSNRSETQVTVHAPEVSRDTSTFTPVNSTLQADGKSTQVLTLTIRNAQNQTVDIAPSDISVKSETPKSAVLSAPVRKSAGIYEVTVTAGTDTETVSVIPTVKGVMLSSSGVSMTSMEPDAAQSQFSAAPQSIEANNTSESTLSLVVRDANGRTLSGVKDSLAFTIKDSSSATISAGALTLSAITESATNGTYTATMKGVKAGKYTITPLFNGSAIGNLSTTVTLYATVPSQEKSSITTDSTSYVAGDDMTITVTLNDAAGNPVTGDAASLTADTVRVQNATVKSGSSWQDNGGGNYSAVYTATTAITATHATLSLNGWSAWSEVYAIKEGAPVPESAIVKTDKTIYLAGEEIVVTVNLWDAYGNRVMASRDNIQIGEQVAKAVKVQNSLTRGGFGMDFGGNFFANFYAVTQGTDLKASLQLSGWTQAVESAAFAIISAAPVQEKSSITTDKTAYIQGRDNIVLTVTLNDAQGNAIMGSAPYLTEQVIQVPGANLRTGSSWQDNGDGTYTATYEPQNEGVNLKATLKMNGWVEPSESLPYLIKGI